MPEKEELRGGDRAIDGKSDKEQKESKQEIKSERVCIFVSGCLCEYVWVHACMWMDSSMPACAHGCSYASMCAPL